MHTELGVIHTIIRKIPFITHTKNTDSRKQNAWE